MQGYYKDFNGQYRQPFSSMTPWNKGVYIIENIAHTMKYVLVGLLCYGLLAAFLAINGN